MDMLQVCQGGKCLWWVLMQVGGQGESVYKENASNVKILETSVF